MINQNTRPIGSNGHLAESIPDSEVTPPTKRRIHTAAYKRRIVEEANACTERGSIGELLRREGLYSSQLATWRQQYGAKTLTEKKRGRKGDPQAREIADLKRENAHLRRELEKAQLIMEAQKKLSAILGLSLDNEIDRSSGE